MPAIAGNQVIINIAPSNKLRTAFSGNSRQAPTLAEGTGYNSEPTTQENLRGQVVLVDFWTFGCYNCINTLPALKSYDAKFRNQRFTIVGVETPEYDSEKKPANLQRSIAKHGIKRPIVTDYDGETWRAFATHLTKRESEVLQIIVKA